MQFDLVKEALLASGVKGDEQLVQYLGKLESFHKRLIPEMRNLREPLAIASVLFDWLWSQKPKRYKSNGSFRFNEVIDAQMSHRSLQVGNCLGLTLFYNCLLRKFDIRSSALYLEGAFGIGPHVLTVMQVGGSSIDIENILPNGFNYKGHLNNSSRIRWGDVELVADIYHSVGNVCFQDGKYQEALKNYDMSITLNPRYEKALLNRTIVMDKIGG
jgi:tetratricopeptide (TPR) repeat protein